MARGQSKLTAQGQVSVPAPIRKKLGLGTGAVLEWDAEGDEVVVRRVGRYSSEDVHRVLFPKPPRPRTLSDLRAGIAREMNRRHAKH